MNRKQDSRTIEEDQLLAKTVLRNIREGGTQLGVFEEVGQHVKRTPAAR
ncbi:hypothetical protein [Mesobacillus subterraneus]